MSSKTFNPLKAAAEANLFAAVKANNFELVEQILSRPGAKPDVRDKMNATPLMYAINEGLGDMVRLLLTYKADINAEGPNGWFPLLFAVERKRHNILGDLLLRPTIQINKTLPDGTTVLHVAAQNNDPVAAKLLLVSGADVNAVNDNGTTPFMMLAHHKSSTNLSQIKRVFQDAIANAAPAEEVAAKAPANYIFTPQKLKNKMDGGRRKTRRRRHNKRTSRHAK